MSTMTLPPARALALSRVTLPASLFGFFVVLMGGIVMLRPALDADLGWHLRTGALILQTHAIPRTDPYSYTRLGAPWVEQEWLWQLVATVINNLAGNLGLVFANAALIAGTLAAIYLRLRLRFVAPMFAAVGAGLALANLGFYAEVRPYMITAPLAAIYLIAFERYEVNHDWRWLASTLPLQLLWANIHGSFVVGLALCGVFGAAAVWESRAWRAAIPWGAAFAGLLTASLVNPLGPGLIRFTLFASRLPFNRERIAEWEGPDFTSWGFAPLMGCLLLTVVLLYLCRNWPRSKTQALLLIGCTFAALYSRQFLVLYAVVAAPILAELLFHTAGRPWRTDISAVSGAVLAIATVVLTVAVPGRSLQPTAYEQAVAKTYPVGAVKYIDSLGLTGPLWDEFNWSGWLINAMPNMPVFVDGRTELYGQDFMSKYLDIELGMTNPDPTFQQYGINLALIPSDGPLANELRQKPQWTEAYEDTLASVFVRSQS